MRRPAPDGERPPPPRDETPRQALRRLLATGGAWTVAELSPALHRSQQEVADDLRALIDAGERITQLPPECRACGFVFTGRARTARPGRCPACKGSRIRPAAFVAEPAPAD